MFDRRYLFTIATRLRRSICPAPSKMRRRQLQEINQTLPLQRELRPIYSDFSQETHNQSLRSMLLPQKGQTQSFRIHKNFICYYSPFFDAAFNGKSIEGKSQGPELDDTPHEVFGIFVNWLYMQKIEIKSDCEWDIRCILLMNVWLLADRAMVPRLQNEALALLERAGREDREFPPSQYQRIYRNTTKDSPLRACIVKMWPDLTISNSELYPRELLVDLVNRLGPMKRESEEAYLNLLSGGIRGPFVDYDDFDLAIEEPIAEKIRVSPDMLEVPQQGKTKRKLIEMDFAEENTRGSIA
ncbi:hypothetical protein L207DRAFT_566493 [Hyaloscypha variabilis F]|uniref:BTB domain-containing protein n=1 Tax=Hyaloscypha variabilis (strain UAMH 11265 / GT02V1 / F) TaxID=1149755 RepID=A0A2J6RLX3_HYAVF|nr:hypothetical protein L207DRAFT_566493 [Hyaloscypha variabilis F]